MSSEENSIKFYLNILEISGKQVVNAYVNNLQKYMDDKGLKYKFEVVTDEDFFVKHKHTTRGGNSTFPYKHFESAFDNVKNMISFNKDKPSNVYNKTNLSNETIQSNSIELDETVNIDYSKQSNEKTADLITTNIDDNKKSNKFNDETNKPIDTIIDRFTVYKPLELDSTTEIKYPSLPLINLNIPDDYDGVIHILLTIHINNTKDTNIIQGGITQLNQFLTTMV